MKRMPFALALILAGIGTLSLAVVAAQDGETEKQQSRAPLTPDEIPEIERTRVNPFAGEAESAERGKMVFSSQCTMCHGADGRGTGDLVERLKLEIPDFTDAEWQSRWSDGAFFYVINTGHSEMPGQSKRFQDEMKWDLVNYVRTFAK